MIPLSLGTQPAWLRGMSLLTLARVFQPWDSLELNTKCCSNSIDKHSHHGIKLGWIYLVWEVLGVWNTERTGHTTGRAWQVSPAVWWKTSFSNLDSCHQCAGAGFWLHREGQSGAWDPQLVYTPFARFSGLTSVREMLCYLKGDEFDLQRQSRVWRGPDGSALWMWLLQNSVVQTL